MTVVCTLDAYWADDSGLYVACRHSTFTLDDAEKQMENPRIAFAANQARLKRLADQGLPHPCSFASVNMDASSRASV